MESADVGVRPLPRMCPRWPRKSGLGSAFVWKIDDKGPGLYEPWQQVKQPFVQSQTLRLKLAPAPAESEVTLYLVARSFAHRGTGPAVLWDQPRFEGGNRPPLYLRDVPAVAEATRRALAAEFAEATKYLAAVAEWSRDGASRSIEAVADDRGLNADRLQRWIDAVGLYRDLPGPLEPLPVKIAGSTGRPFINGWGSKTADTLPSLVSNSSNQAAAIPGTVPAHKVAVHPAPREYVAVAWRSPIDARVRLAAKVADAHAGCGNGVAWWLEVERIDPARGTSRARLETPARPTVQARLGRRERLVSGAIDDGKAADIAPRELHVRRGDQICLAIGARDGNHFCDLTLIDLTITELGGARRSWSLSGDVADTVLAGNPHADRQGNSGVWEFAKGQDHSSATLPAFLPPGSTLAAWRAALDRGAPPDELAKLADRVQRLLTGPRPSGAGNSGPGRPDTALFDALSSAGSRLIGPIDPAKLPAAGATANSPASPYGLDPARFGKASAGRKIAATSLASSSPIVMKIRLPGAAGGQSRICRRCAHRSGRGRRCARSIRRSLPRRPGRAICRSTGRSSAMRPARRGECSTIRSRSSAGCFRSRFASGGSCRKTPTGSRYGCFAARTSRWRD